MWLGSHHISEVGAIYLNEHILSSLCSYVMIIFSGNHFPEKSQELPEYYEDRLRVTTGLRLYQRTFHITHCFIQNR